MLRSLVAIAIAMTLAACKEDKRPAPQPGPSPVQNQAVDLTAGTWDIRFSPNVPPRADLTRGLAVPSSDGIHYVTRRVNGVAGSRITLRYRFEGDCRPVPTDSPPPARLRLLVQRGGDSLTANQPHHRWWSSPIELTVGEHELSVALDPTRWTNVFGKGAGVATNDAERASLAGEFTTTLRLAENAGFTWGGTFAGHGVYCASGSGVFTLLSYRIEP